MHRLRETVTMPQMQRGAASEAKPGNFMAQLPTSFTKSWEVLYLKWSDSLVNVTWCSNSTNFLKKHSIHFFKYKLKLNKILFLIPFFKVFFCSFQWSYSSIDNPTFSTFPSPSSQSLRQFLQIKKLNSNSMRCTSEHFYC